jgi:hypothetical protein
MATDHSCSPESDACCTARRAERGMQRQRCKMCWHADKFDFGVPDQVWVAIVPEGLQKKSLCLACFDDLARDRGVAYAPSLVTLYFAGDRASFEFRTVSAVTVEGSH